MGFYRRGQQLATTWRWLTHMLYTCTNGTHFERWPILHWRIYPPMDDYRRPKNLEKSRLGNGQRRKNFYYNYLLTTSKFKQTPMLTTCRFLIHRQKKTPPTQMAPPSRLMLKKKSLLDNMTPQSSSDLDPINVVAIHCGQKCPTTTINTSININLGQHQGEHWLKKMNPPIEQILITQSSNPPLLDNKKLSDSLQRQLRHLALDATPSSNLVQFLLYSRS